MTAWPELVHAARERIAEHVRTTPVERSAVLERAGARRVWLKLENQQVTGSFKVRGALNTVLALSPEQRDRGVVAASSGNHGAGIAHAASITGCPTEVFVPNDTPRHKIDAITALGATVHRFGDDCVETERRARKHAADRDATYVSPYNDRRVIAGQGTIAPELIEQVGQVDAVLVALGGGGLISGIGTWLAATCPGVEVVACSPRNSPVMHASLAAGHIVEMPTEPTLSHSTAGGVEPGAITFELCQRVVGHSIVVDEDEIASALRLVVGHHHTLIEGAAAVAVAGYLRERERFAGRDVAILLCGANIGLEELARLLHTAAPDDDPAGTTTGA